MSQAGGDASQEARLIPLRWEQLLGAVGALVAILGTVVPAMTGVSLTGVTSTALILFVMLIGANIYFTVRNARLSQILAVTAGALVFGVVAAHLYIDGNAAEIAEMGGDAKGTIEKKIVIVPPRLEINAWIDLPMIERSIDGKEVHLDGNGKQDPQERSIQPIEVRAYSRNEPTRLQRIPGQFNEFTPGESVTANFCGLNFSRETYNRTDKRYADQIVWDIPVKLSQAGNC